MTIQRIIEVHAERSTDTVKDLKTEINQLKDALLNVDKASEDYDKGLKLLREDQKRLNEVNALTKKSVDALPGSYNALNAKLVQARKDYKELTAEERANAEVGGKLLKEIKNLDAELKQMDADMGNYQRNVGNYKSALDGLNEKFGKIRGALLAVGAVIAAGVKLLKGYFDTLRSNVQEFGDYFKFETAGMKAAYMELINTMYTGQGWNQLIANMKEAYANGKQFAAMLDEIFERNNSLRIAEAEYAEEIEKSRIAARNTALTNEERLAAAENAIRKEAELAKMRKDVAEQEMEANRGLLMQKTKMTEEDIKYYINNYNQNRQAIREAQEYLEREKDLTGKIASETQVRNYTRRAEYQQTLDNLRNGLSAEAAAILEITKKYNLSNDELVGKYVDSYVKFQTVEADFQKANSRTLLTRDRMLKEVAGNEIKTVDKTSTEVRQKWMSDNDYYLLILKDRAKLTEEGSQEQLDALKAVREQEFVIETERLTNTIENEEKRAEAVKLAEEVKNADLLAMEEEFAANQQAILDQEAEAERRAAEQRAREEEQRIKAEQAAWERLHKAKIATVNNAFTTMLSLYEAFGDESAKESNGYKAIASAQAVVQALLSANEAYASMASIPYVGPALGAVAAAAALAQGMAQVRAINATNMKGSTSTPAVNTTTPTASVSAPAVIQQVESTRTLTGVEEEQRMNNAQRVYLVYDDVQQAGKKVSVEQSESTF